MADKEDPPSPMTDGGRTTPQVRFLDGGWSEELVDAAQDAIECCIASAFVSPAVVGLLSRVAERMAGAARTQASASIRVLVSAGFAATPQQRADILRRLLDLPGVEVRVFEGDERLHAKNYIFRTERDLRVVIGSVNATAAGLHRNIEFGALTHHTLEDPEGLRIREWFDGLWSEARRCTKETLPMPAPTPKFQKGDNVRIVTTEQVGTVNEVRQRQEDNAYRVMANGRARWWQEKYLEAWEGDAEQAVVDALDSGDFGGPDDYRLFQTAIRLRAPVEGTIYSYLGSRTRFNAYQFKPLLKFLAPGSAERLFIADEVGVGKTIETGIILTELLGRGRLDGRPILVVCPNALGPKWQKEMERRFRLSFHLHDGSSLHEVLRRLSDEGRVPDRYRFGIVSLQLLRVERHRERLVDAADGVIAAPWGMVVIDEAHHLRNPETESNAIGTTLSGLTDMMLLLSATPLNLADSDLFNQMHVLNPGMFPDEESFKALLEPVRLLNRLRRRLADPEARDEVRSELEQLFTMPGFAAGHPALRELRGRLDDAALLSSEEVARFGRHLAGLSPLDSSFTRTLKREALEHVVTREPMKVPVELSPTERAFHDRVIQAVQDAMLARGLAPGSLEFATNMTRRMASSCLPALQEYIAGTLQSGMMLGDESGIGEPLDDDADERLKQPLPPELRTTFEELQTEAERLADVDTKYEQFRALLRQLLPSLARQQVLVFSFFVRTLEYLKRRLAADGFRVDVIHGGVPLVSDRGVRGRDQVMEDFEQGKLDILLSSEVGGEGLDFQFCQAIVNYDLPYNPMRVEQRIGRVDRFGQTAEKIVVASMYLRDTLDERIYDLLYDRIRIVEDCVGALEPILGTKLLDLQRELIAGELSPEQAEARAKVIELAVEQAKLEQERFEKGRRELMGEEYVTTPLQQLDRNADFIRPEDAASLTEGCVARWPDCDFERTGEDRGRLTLSPELTARLEQHLRRPVVVGASAELRPLIEGQSPIPVVFNGDTADEHRDHRFLPPTGAWVRFLLEDVKDEGLLRSTFRLGMARDEAQLPVGEYVVPIFEVRLEGLRTELSLAAVPVHRTDGRPREELDYRAFARVLAKAEDAPTLEDAPLDAFEVVETALQSLEGAMRPLLDDLQSEHHYRIETRRQSIERGASVRISRLEEQLQSHRERRKDAGEAVSESFVRMTDGRIALEKRRRDELLQQLDARENLSMSTALIGAVALHVCE